MPDFRNLRIGALRYQFLIQSVAILVYIFAEISEKSGKFSRIFRPDGKRGLTKGCQNMIHFCRCNRERSKKFTGAVKRFMKNNNDE